VVMRIEKMLRQKRNTVAAVILAVVVLLPIGYYAMRNAFSAGQDPFLEKPDPKYRECVKDTYYMRLHHMDLLKELREQVVREGKKSEIRFADCRRCHTNRDRFCNQCHYAVNLYLDCFGCHNYPDSPPAAAGEQASGPDTNEDILKSGH
jgi:hypothetical protein